MGKFVFSGVAAGLIGGAMLLSGSAPASAATLPSAALVAPGHTAMVEEVQQRGRVYQRERRGDPTVRHGDRSARHYDRGRHGPRYSRPRAGFRHHYGGYYYGWPWWTGPSIGFGITVPGVTFGLGGGLSSAHVQWCMNRYRTYDPATDTYVPRIGVRAYCISPYS